MKCPNCGNEINNGNKFCAICGTKVENNIVIKKKINPKLLGVIIGGIIGLIFIIFLIVKLTGLGTDLIWNEAYSHYKLEYISPTTIKLGIDIEDDKLQDVKIKTTCGKTERIGYSINWDLNDAKGKCEIEVSYKLKKISKEYTVIKTSSLKEKKDLVMDSKIDYNSSEDLDYDGLTNKEEKGYKTNPEVADSDLDGLDDKEELMTYKTDPNKGDSDSDGLNDYDEIKLGLDPLKSDSKGDGIKDGDRKLTYNYTSDNITIDITGKGNIASLTAQVTDNTKISGKRGMIDKLYTFYTDGKLEQAVIKIKYTDEELTKYGVNEDNLSLYYYNTSKSTYEKVDTIVDKDNNILTVTLTHFSNYVVGDTTLVNEKPVSHVLFVLDNSGSMYGNNGSDPDGERFKVSSKLVSNLETKNYLLGISEFRNDYANIYSIGNKYSDVKNKLEKMNGTYATRSDGTNITNALNNGMGEFSNEADNKFIILLTDGKDSGLKNNIDSIISSANSKNIKICTVGFGDGIDSTELSRLAIGTGCKFYSSSDSDGLKELFNNVEVELSDNLIDVDSDGTTDGILVADSGFIVSRDGFSFSNYSSDLTSGHCYGMATFAELYYKKVLPMDLNAIEINDFKVNAYNLKNTYFSNYSNLYDYKFQSKELAYVFGFDYMGLETPIDLRKLDGDKLVFLDNHKSTIKNTGYLDIYEYKSTLNKQEQLEKWGVNYTLAEDVMLNEKNMKDSNINNVDKNLFYAIYTSFVKQDIVKHYSSGGNLALYLRDFLNVEEVKKYSGKKFIDILITRLNDQDPVVITSNYDGGLHAVNAISLVQDIDNSNYYYIGVYDNNYPGEKRYVDVECKKDVCVTKANSYYKGSGEPIRLTLSLQDDLEYYQRGLGGAGGRR